MRSCATGSPESSTRRSIRTPPPSSVTGEPPTTRSAADCRPRTSPPASCPAVRAASSRSGRPPPAALSACAIAGSTSVEVSMLPCTLQPSPTTWPLTGKEPWPVSVATRPEASSTAICRSASSAACAARRTSSAGEAPSASPVSSDWPSPRRLRACTATIPTPGRALGTARPTARMQEETAMPRSPVSASRARAEKVTGAPRWHSWTRARGCCVPGATSQARSHSDREPHRRDLVGHDQRRAGGGDDLVDVDAGGDLTQDQSLVGHVDDGEVGDDPVDAGRPGQRQGALLEDLRRPVTSDVLHHHDDPAGALHQVHGATHAVDHLAGDQPVGEVAAGVDLHGAEDRDVEVTAADHPERQRGVEEAGTGQDRDRLLARVDQVGVLVALEGVGTDAEGAVLAVQHDVHALGHVVRHQGRHTDPEIDVLAVLQLEGHAGGELVAGECHQADAPSMVASSPAAAGADSFSARGRGVRFSIFLPSVPTTTTRCTKTPGRCTSSGRISPGSTSSSTSAMVILPAMPASGLKLRADSWKTRLPCRSPIAARTRAKSAVSAVSST